MYALRFDPSHRTDRFDVFDRYLNPRNWEARSPNAYDVIFFVVVHHHGARGVRKYATAIYMLFK
jgi:hypothetical protein